MSCTCDCAIVSCATAAGTERRLPWLRSQRLSRRRQSQNSAPDFFLHRILAQQSSRRASSNSWTGHRAAVESAGFGFLVLFNGRLYAQLKTVANATRLGRSDARAAAAAARREGFPRATIIFLDQEQGGRMLPEQKAYIYAWVDGITAAGFRAGIYCSGIPCDRRRQRRHRRYDIREHAGSRDITYWAINDACPPAPGCAFPQHPPSPAQSGSRIRRSLAVRAVPAAQRCCRALHQLQPRRKLLPSRLGPDRRPYRRKHGHVARSLAR